MTSPNVLGCILVRSQWQSSEYSSIARGRGGYSTPIGMSTKMHNEKNTTFLALLRQLNALEWTK